MMHMTRTKGFSIMELIVYVAIFGLVSVVVINSFVVVLNSYATTRTNRDLMESGLEVMERMSREIRQAKSIDLINSTFGTSPGVLQLNTTDSSGNAQTVKFIVESNKINLYVNNTYVGVILNYNISVSSLIFRRISTSQGDAVKIELTLQDTPGHTTKLEKFYDTVTVRGNY